MDRNLMLLMGPPGLHPGQRKPVETSIRIREDYSGEIEVVRPGEDPKPYTLKTLPEVYGTGPGGAGREPSDDELMPVLMAIEEEITRCYEDQPSLTDGAVVVALKQLSMNPDSVPTDPLARRIQLKLRLTLSLNDFSRQDVRRSVRQVLRSVERHSRAEGRRGYLEFMRTFFARRP
jgi:hypothetical protein